MSHVGRHCARCCFQSVSKASYELADWGSPIRSFNWTVSRVGWLYWNSKEPVETVCINGVVGFGIGYLLVQAWFLGMLANYCLSGELNSKITIINLKIGAALRNSVISITLK